MFPHLKDVLRCGAFEVDVCFGEAVEYGPETNRKQASATIAQRIRSMLGNALRGRNIA
jgi:hypothetical protein